MTAALEMQSPVSGLLARRPNASDFFPAMVKFEITACGSEEQLCRPCVDCKRKTPNYCDGKPSEGKPWGCLAKDRLPEEKWCEGQRTPLSMRSEPQAKGGSGELYCVGWCMFLQLSFQGV